MAACGGIFGAGVAWTTIRMRLNKTVIDVNGVGRSLRRSIACQLRCVAEEEPISKAKVLHIADLIDPK